MDKKSTKANLVSYWDRRGQNRVFYKNESFYTVTPIPLYINRRKKLLEKIGITIDNHLQKDKNRSINLLDFGCGDGYYSIYIKHNYPSFNVSGCDLSKSMINIARKQSQILNLKISFEKADGEIPFQARFDIIIIVAVFAHIIDEEIMNGVIKDISTKLNENGLILLFEQTGSIMRFGETWIRRTEKIYIENFSKYNLILKDIHQLEYPFFFSIDRTIRKLLNICISFMNYFNKKLGNCSNLKLENLNKYNLYLSLCELLLFLSPLFDSLFKSKDRNTIFIFKKRNGGT